jgi:hypothetical protein
MYPALARLIEALPPPANPCLPVSWTKAEERHQLRFPSHFKALFDVYGDSEWFDLFYPFYPDRPDKDGEYLEGVRHVLSILVDYGMTDEDFKPLTMPLYPEPGGLFPFMNSSDGDYYYWNTDSDNPDEWPIMRWEMDTLRKLKFATLADLFLETLEWMKEKQPHRVWVRARSTG